MKNKVSFKVFIWAIGLLLTVITWQTVSINSIREDMSIVKVNIGSMQTDIGWIKSSIADNKNITFK